METILNTADSLLLESANWSDEGLRIELIELFVSHIPEAVQITNRDAMENLRAITPSEHSRKFIIQFESCLTWQMVDESAVCHDTDEVVDSGGFIRIIRNSKYLDYVRQQFGWYEQIIGQTRHFRIWSENRIIDVVSIKEPEIRFEL